MASAAGLRKGGRACVPDKKEAEVAIMGKDTVRRVRYTTHKNALSGRSCSSHTCYRAMSAWEVIGENMKLGKDTLKRHGEEQCSSG